MDYFLKPLFILIIPAFISCTPGETDPGKTIEGLREDVVILRDRWGVNHIYASNEQDLFFAQGYAAAKDRLFQFEVWRRQATGTVSEILGERELKRDIGTRLFQFRGNMDTELNYYHPRGREIIESFVDGVNAFIMETESDPALLPIEFEILNIRPGYWTPRDVISRHQGLLGNIGNELDYGRSVALLGAERVKELANFQPWEPDIELDPEIPKELLMEDILELYYAYRRPLIFQPEDVIEKYRAKEMSFANHYNELVDFSDPGSPIGSNNWIISPEKSASGHTMMANDPHRTQAVPSLRYMVHLNAPGWNVAGGGEPEIPGVSIGHNEYGAWGLTVFRTDGEDLLYYKVNPDDPNQYWHSDNWLDMEIVSDTIPVRGREPEIVENRYTLHGPVVYQQGEHAFAVRCAWMEPGGSPYLASLRMDQATTWEEFREACNYSHIPGENMIWAGTDGTIGWQSVGIAPIRENFSGLVPVPGDGRYEWQGYLPIIEKPYLVNPGKGYFATANENVVPEDYPNNGAVGFEWSDKFRGERIAMVLDENDQVTMEDMMTLQTDYYSIPASRLVPLLEDVSSEGKVQTMIDSLMQWNYRMEKNSIAASIYVTWERRLRANLTMRNIPEEARPYLSVSMTRVVEWITENNEKFTGDREALLLSAMEEVLPELEDKLGTDMKGWQYGQEKFRHALIRHPLRQAVNEEWRSKLNVGPIPRAGYSYTVGAGGGVNNQTSGASFRFIVDTGDWDATMAMNNPGQSGDPSSSFYDNLFESWANDEFFPFYFSRQKIEENAAEKVVLRGN